MIQKRELTVVRRAFNILVALDQLIWVVVTIGYGHPDETISSAAYRYEKIGATWAKIARPLIDALFFWETDHCRMAYHAEILRQQAPLSPLEALEEVKKYYPHSP